MKLNQICHTNQKQLFNKQNITTSKNISENNKQIKELPNISFSGFFFNEIEAQDARLNLDDFYMEANKPYLVDDETVFVLAGDFELDLNSKEVKPYIENLKPNEHVIFGRKNIFLDGMDGYISSEHLKIKKNFKGQLIATDLNSTNGTKIAQNLILSNFKSKNFDLEPKIYTYLPKTAVLLLGKTQKFPLTNCEKFFNRKPIPEKITVGRHPSSDIRIDNTNISRNHLEIKKFKEGYLVKDLNSTNGTKVIENPENPFELPEITKITKLKEGIKTKVPSDSQLYLGNDLTIDLRNPNILNLLEEKGSITIGRSSECDLIVNDFYSKVSRKHLKLEKHLDSIYATCLGSTNGTKIIPKNEIKPFYCDLDKLELSQANVGDCYLLSTIYAMSRNSKGQEILKNMVKVDDDGNYIVKFYDKAPITVKLEELDGQKNGNDEKRSVSGSLGIKAIERAYGKMLKEESINTIYYPKTMFFKIDDGGYMSTALEKMTGIRSVNCNMKHENVFPELYNLYYNNPENYIITCGTPDKKDSRYIDKEYRFNRKHAYAVKNIDAINETIEIINPHNTKKSEIISWNEFQQYFDILTYAYAN